MSLNVREFFNACNPSKTINMEVAKERKYYINFSSVRGVEIVEELGQTIILSDEPTCQLFTGHIGCGKSTELLRLKQELHQQSFHVVYFESSQYLDLADVDISDILLLIARKVSESLTALGIKLKPGYFATLFKDIGDLLQTPVDISLGLEFGVAKIAAITKEDPRLRNQLRDYLENRNSDIIQSINDEIIVPGIEKLKQIGKQGLVVIVDNLDKIDDRPKAWGRPQPEYLFIDRGDKLRHLKCHLVYTIPLGLIFCNEYGTLQNILGSVKVLPMVPVQLRDGRDYAEGIALLRQMVMARAFPDLTPEMRMTLVAEVFESIEILDRLCYVSGGHVRNLLRLLYTCIPKKHPPLSLDVLESVIRQRRNELTLPINLEQKWDLLREIEAEKQITKENGYTTLLRSMVVFEYRDPDGSWFDINPILKDI